MISSSSAHRPPNLLSTPNADIEQHAANESAHQNQESRPAQTRTPPAEAPANCLTRCMLPRPGERYRVSKSAVGYGLAATTLGTGLLAAAASGICGEQDTYSTNIPYVLGGLIGIGGLAVLANILVTHPVFSDLPEDSRFGQN